MEQVLREFATFKHPLSTVPMRSRQCLWIQKKHIMTKHLQGMRKINLRADIFRSINPRLNVSAQIPDLTWKVSFFCGGMDFSVVFWFKLTPLWEEFCVDCVDTGLVWEEVKSPKTSDVSKLFRGMLAKGSITFGFVGSVSTVLFTAGNGGSDAAKRSTVEEEGPEYADWANKSTLSCRKEGIQIFINENWKQIVYKWRRNNNMKEVYRWWWTREFRLGKQINIGLHKWGE